MWRDVWGMSILVDMRNLASIALCVVCTLVIAVSAWGARPAAARQDERMPGQVLVRFRPGTSDNVVEATLRAHGAHTAGRITALGVLVLSVPERAQDAVVEALSHNPNVEYAEPDYLAHADMVPDDPAFSLQWGLENANDADIDASAAWETTTGSGVSVAILDSGISSTHPDVTGKVTDRTNFSDAVTDDDVYGHGTHVAGIVAAATGNGMGVAGVCPACTLMSVKVLNDGGSGAYSWIAKGITYAADNGAKVINMSLGGSQKSSTLESAVKYAWGKGVVVVAAAGNAGNQSKTYPGAYTDAIAVAATDNQDTKASFSEYGSWVDIAAPGVGIYSTWNDATSPSNPQPECQGATGCYKYASGTSMATPMVSGVAGLIWSTGTYATPVDVRGRLEASADKIPGTGTSWRAGRVNAANAVSDTVYDTPIPTQKPGRK